MQNVTGTYALNGSAGHTNDTNSTDGWIQYINTTEFGSGLYNLTVQSYNYTPFIWSLESTDTKENIFIDNQVPSGTLSIYGLDGSLTTDSINTYLNLFYVDNGEIKECRFANDAEANLVTALWESCVTVKPWILSSGFGNKTVYAEYRDYAQNTIVVNDSIMYIETTVDKTAPTIPIVYDGITGKDIDWWNLNSVLGAYWWNATEDMSEIYYNFRIWNDTTNITSYTNTGTENEVTVTGLSLDECFNYSFEIIAYNTAGKNSTAVFSNGTIIDLTNPDKVIINSTTHPDQTSIYSNGTTWLNWSSTDRSSCGNPSGIKGYSYIMDSHSGTMPDDNLEEYSLIKLQDFPTNWNTDKELKIATTGNAYSFYFQGNGNLSIGDVIRVGFKLREDNSETTDLFNFSIFLLKKISGSEATNFGFDESVHAISQIINLDQDFRYVSNLNEAKTYYYEFTINETLTNEDWYFGMLSSTIDDDNTNAYNLVGTNDSSEIDNTTKVFQCIESGSCTDMTNSFDGINLIKFDYQNQKMYELSDGIYYFHIRAEDNAGNWGDTGHYKVNVDTIGAGIRIESPTTGQIFTTENITVTAEVTQSANVTIYVTYTNGTITNVSNSQIISSTGMFNVTLTSGMNQIYATAKDIESGVLTTSLNVNIRYSTNLPEANKTLVIRNSGAVNALSKMVWGTSGSAYIGIASEDPISVTAGVISTNTDDDNSIKIFLTNPFTPTDVNVDLVEDDFMDREVPLFGFDKKRAKEFIIRTAVRYPNVYFTGTRMVTEGKYTLIFNNAGMTSENKTNITVRII